MFMRKRFKKLVDEMNVVNSRIIKHISHHCQLIDKLENTVQEQHKVIVALSKIVIKTEVNKNVRKTNQRQNNSKKK